ncbi:MAG: hypothetical protein HY245_11020 [Rhizobiales bacterium]|nr:hypothetical protein [Hyphomicrobiales bacterium]
MSGLDITWAPLLPQPVLMALAIAGLALIGLLAFARLRWLPLRAAALVILFLSLLDPSIRREVREPLTDIAVAVVDHSLSQEASGRIAATDAALQTLRDEVGALPNTELRVVEVRSGIASGDDGTRAFAALNRALAEIPPERFAGAVMVTDGEIHDAPADPKKSGIGGPLHGLITGAKNERDRRVVIDRAPRFGIVGKEQTIRFRIEDQNGDGAPVAVTVSTGKGDPITLSVTAGMPVEIPITVDHGGQNIAEIAAAPLPGEISLANNRAIAVIEGIRDRLRVLLISGEPHPGERTWRNLLKADAAVDLVHFTILRPPEKQDGTPIKELALIAFPTRELFVDKINEFDLVIFDRYRRQTVLPLAYLQNVADYVANGGAVLIASGPDFIGDDGLYNTPLADVIPAPPTGDVLEGAFRPALTADGRKHPVTRGLPGSAGQTPSWGRWFRMVDTQPARGTTVMQGTGNRPLLVLSREGKGRVAQILSDQGWLWARGYDGGGPQSELLRRIAHWLMKEPDLEEEALGASQSGNQLVIERRTMAESAKPVSVTLPSGKTTTVPLAEAAPGLWRGKFAITEPGLHRLSDGTLEAVAAAGSADAREAADLIATDRVLAPVAKATGGAIDWLADGMPRLVKTHAEGPFSGPGWLGLRANGAYRVTAVSELPLFSTLLSLGVLLLGLCGLWYREGR